MSDDFRLSLLALGIGTGRDKNEPSDVSGQSL